MTTSTAAATTDRAASSLLRTALRVDGWGTGVFGCFLLVSGGWLSAPLGLPSAWFVPGGVAMLATGAALLGIASGRTIPDRLAAAAVVINALCCVGVLVLTFADVLPLTGWGTAFLLAAALWVGVFAELEAVGLRRYRRRRA